LNFTNYRQDASVFSDRQFLTGKKQEIGHFLSGSAYNQALDALVLGCADIIPMHNSHILIGLRAWEPQRDWWCFGGRMRKGELYQTAAARNVKRELFQGIDNIEIHPNRFALVGVYNLIWDKRAQEPIESGCHTLSVTMLLPLKDIEVALLHTNEEYHEVRWILPEEIIHHPDRYHPCLVQMAKDIVSLNLDREIDLGRGC